MSATKCKAIGCTSNRLDPLDFCLECVAELAASQEPNVSLKTSGQQLTLAEESDPHGMSQHTPGAKVDAGKIRMHLITGGMARGITEVAKVGTFGAAKYSDNGWIAVPDGFRRYEDAQQRHAAKRHIGEIVDADSGLLHLAHEAWNALAKLDLYIREHEVTAPSDDRIGH